MPSKFAIMMFIAKLGNEQKVLLGSVIEIVMDIYKEVKKGNSVDDFCDMAESIFSKFIATFRK